MDFELYEIVYIMCGDNARGIQQLSQLKSELTLAVKPIVVLKEFIKIMMRPSNNSAADPQILTSTSSKLHAGDSREEEKGHWC